MGIKKRESQISNYIPINRRFFNHAFWKEKRTFSKSEAWLFLMVEARFDESEVTELIGGKMVSWRRGELPASIRFLGERWGWDKNKVESFLRMLEKETMIARRLCKGQTIITLLNYEVYNPKKGQQTGQQTGHVEPPQGGFSQDHRDSRQDSKRDTGGTATGQGQDNTNTDNKENIEKERLNRLAASFAKFQDWIKQNAPTVAKMKEPFTMEQYEQLTKKFKDRAPLEDLLLSMHNWEPLVKKNKSAYLTILNWSKKTWNQNAGNGDQATGKDISDEARRIQQSIDRRLNRP